MTIKAATKRQFHWRVDAQSHGTMLAIEFALIILLLRVRSEPLAGLPNAKKLVLGNSVFYCGEYNEFKKELKK